MFNSGRLLVLDAPFASVASRLVQTSESDVLTYADLLEYIAKKCEGEFSGASLAAITRAAASRALERAICNFDSQNSTVTDCVVSQTDFEQAIQDVLESSRGGGGEVDN
jgi:SpoVK/Ycf46/Vps4 family AAA+-type ATPase